MVSRWGGGGGVKGVVADNTTVRLIVPEFWRGQFIFFFLLKFLPERGLHDIIPGLTIFIHAIIGNVSHTVGDTSSLVPEKQKRPS